MNRKNINWSMVLASIILTFQLFSTFIIPVSLIGAPDDGGKPKKVPVYLFWGKGCHSCAEEKPFLEDMQKKYPDMELKTYEVFNNKENYNNLKKLLEAHKIEFEGVPVVFIGSSYFSGSSEVDRKIQEKTIVTCIEKGCTDAFDKLKSETTIQKITADNSSTGTSKESGTISKTTNASGTEKSSQNTKSTEQTQKGGNVAGQAMVSESETSVVDKDSSTISLEAEQEKNIVQKDNESVADDQPSKNIADQGQESEEDSLVLPLLGRKAAGEVSIPLVTFIIAGIDSFNPCAFFVLFSLLGLLIHAKSRKRMILIGIIFVFFSALIYFMFMAAWLNLFLVLGHVRLITFIAGVTAVIIAGINIKDYLFFKKGISLTIPDKAKPKLFEKMRNLVKSASLPSMILGTAILAVMANLYELLCSSGFPMVYTRILTLNNLPDFKYYLYLILYNIIYVIPLLVIVTIFTITLGKRNITEWQGRLMKLISGAMMLSLGLIMVFNPSIINNLKISITILLITVIGAFALAYFTRESVEEVDDVDL